MSTFDLSVFEAPLTVPRLRSGPVLLRPFLLSDLPLIRQAATDPYIPAVTSIPLAYSDDEGRAFIERQHRQAIEGNGYHFVIADSTDPRQAFGGLGLWLHEIESGRASIGYWVIPTTRGKRRAGWALRAVVAFAFEVLAIPRLHLFVEPWNISLAAYGRVRRFHTGSPPPWVGTDRPRAARRLRILPFAGRMDDSSGCPAHRCHPLIG